MTVREFNGTTDRLVTDVGATSGMTYGTVAAIVKFSDLSTFRGIAYVHDSGGTYKGAFGTTNFSNFSLNDGTNDSYLNTLSLSTGVWYLVVVRKATGSGITPRFSVYNFTSGVWTHGNGNNALNDFTAPGVGGTHQFAYQGGAASIFAGRVAARAHWSNTLPWTSDAAGDTAIEAAGLEDWALNWKAYNPTAFHLFNQASASTPVDDLSTAGTADQVSIVGTTPVTGDDPSGFDFSLSDPVPLAAYNFDESSGSVLDRSGNGRNFTLTGNTVRTASGHTSGGLTQTAADIQAGPALTGMQTTSRTWMCWLKLSTSVTGWVMEFHNQGSDTGVWGLLYLSGTLRFRAKNSSNTAFESTSIPADFGVWHHIAATHDGANLRVYRDGVLHSTTAMAFPVWTADDFRILDATGSVAVIDDARLYDKVLSQATIQSLMSTPVASGGAVTLTVQDASQSQTVDSPALTQVHNLAAADASHAQTVDALTLVQTHNLAVQDAAQAQAADSLTLAQVHNLAVGDASQAQTVDQVTLTQVHILTVQDASQGHTTDNVVLSLALTLVVNDALQAHSVDSPSLTQAHVLGVPDTVQGQTADAPVLTQVHNLVVQDATHAQTAESPTLLLFGIAYLLITESGPIPLTLDGVFDGTTVAPVALESIA